MTCYAMLKFIHIELEENGISVKLREPKIIVKSSTETPKRIKI